MSEAFERPPTSQEAVLAALRQAIVRGELRPGEQVRQEALADRFGVSRVPLREALKILEGEGSVRYVPHRGYFVAELSLSDLLEVYRIRQLLEAEAVRVGLPLMTDAQVDAFSAAVEGCEAAGRAGDLVAMTEANRALHFLLVGSPGMPQARATDPHPVGRDRRLPLGLLRRAGQPYGRRGRAPRDPRGRASA